MALFSSSAAAEGPRFVPEQEAQGWLTQALAAVTRHLGPIADSPRWLADPLPRGLSAPSDLDGLFDFICALQEGIGQGEIEFTLAELSPGRPGLPPGFEAIGDARGHLLHTFVRAEELVMVVAPNLFKVRPLLLASVGRELGRLGVRQAGRPEEALASVDAEVVAELAAIALGMGPWIANGAYIFENSCCGGGCGVNLREVRAGLSLPEACFATALDARRKGLSRWTATKGLEATQKAALKANWPASQVGMPALASARAGAALNS